MKPQILSRNKVTDNPYLNLFLINFQNKNGKPGAWLSADRDGSNCAACIYALVGAGTKEPRILITKEFRVPVEDYEWGSAAGLIEPGEDALKCAERELKEETGLTIKRLIRPPSPPVYNSAGMTKESCILFFVEAEGTITDENTEDSEDITTLLMTQEEAKAFIETARKTQDIAVSSKMWIVLERFVEHGDI